MNSKAETRQSGLEATRRHIQAQAEERRTEKLQENKSSWEGRRYKTSTTHRRRHKGEKHATSGLQL